MSSVLITGILKDAFGVPIPNYEFFFEAIRTSETLLNTTNAKFTTSATGAYSFTLEYGTYILKAKAQRDIKYQTIASNILVYSQGLTNHDIQYLLTSQADLVAIDQTLLEALLQVKADILEALTYSVVDKGDISLAGGVYPTPMSNGQGGYFSCLWYVTTGGTVSGTVFNTGDQLIYNSITASYRKIDNTDLVTSVNGMTGVVVVTTITGNAGTATTLQTARTIGVSGDGVGTATSFNGSANITIPFTLNTVATAGTYRSVTVNAKGLVTAGTNPTTLAGYGLTDAQPLDSDLTAIAALATNGIIIRTGTGAATTRSVAVTGTGLSITNADGIAGNITITSNATSANTASTIVARDASGNFTTTGITTTGNITVGGNLIVNGTTTTVNSTSVTLDDPILTLGGDTAPTVDDNKDRGIEFRWHNGTVAKNGFFGFDDSTGYFTFIPDATNTSEVFSGATGTIAASLAGNASTATTLQTARSISSTGDATWTVNFDGSANATAALTLATVATAGTYRSVTIDAKGRVTSGTNPTTLSGYGITDAQPLDSDLTAIAALATNGLITRTAEGTVTTSSIAVTGIGLSITNADGVASNPTITSNATNSNTASTIVSRDASGDFSAGTITAALTGNATTASALQTTRSISSTGDGTWTVSFNGSTNVTAALTLATVATAGTYKSVTVNAKGLVTGGTNPTTLAGYGITDAAPKDNPVFTGVITAPTLKAGTLQTTDGLRSISVPKIAEMNGGFSFRNKIVDGRFDFWYEGASATYTHSAGYGAETMVFNTTNTDTMVVSQQAISPGEIDIPTAIYWSKNTVTSSVGAASYSVKKFKLEDVRTFAGKTVTFSFYAKSDAARNVAVEFIQDFGSGGSPSVNSIQPTIVNIITTGKRYQVTAIIPSIAGKTVGTGSRLEVNIWMSAGANSSSRSANLGQQSGIFYFTAVQLEEGSVSTPFEELPIEVSQMRVNRYFQRYDGSVGNGRLPVQFLVSNNIYKFQIPIMGLMRVLPTITHNLTDANFSSAVNTTTQTWGLLTDAVAWSTKSSGTFTVSVTPSERLMDILVSGGVLANMTTPIAACIGGLCYLNFDARL